MNSTLQEIAARFAEPPSPTGDDIQAAEALRRYEEMIQFELDFAHSPQRVSDYMKGRRYDSLGTLLVARS